MGASYTWLPSQCAPCYLQFLPRPPWLSDAPIVYGPVALRSPFPGMSCLSSTLSPGAGVNSSLLTAAVWLRWWRSSMRLPSSRWRLRTSGSISSHQCSYSATNASYRSWLASPNWSRSPGLAPITSGRLLTSYLYTMRAGGNPKRVGKNLRPASMLGRRSVHGVLGCVVWVILRPARMTPLYLSISPFA